MKYRVPYLKSFRFQLLLTAFVLIAAGAMFAWQRGAHLQQHDAAKTEAKRPVTVQAKGRGNPWISFDDGFEPIAESQNAASPATNLVSADFDSDGVADLATSDAAGMIRLYRGNGPQALVASEVTPFGALAGSFNLGTAPDFLAAGDFNADGFSDLLGAARGADSLAFLAGNGRANFSDVRLVKLNGTLTAAAAGEIGRKDGQTDVVVSYANKDGAFLAVFEHPESAFKYKPEIYKLPGAATEIAIGNLDEDFYADIAVASGNTLTIIHGRGQAYPWDLIPQSGIQRPKAFVASRRMPFEISAMTIGRFGDKRGETLAILGGDGNLYRLEPNRVERPSNNKLSPEMRARAKRELFLPADAEVRNLAVVTDAEITTESSRNSSKLLIDSAEIENGKFGEFLQKKQKEAADKFKQLTTEEREKLLADVLPKKAEYKERAKQGYLRSISGKPSTLANWTVETITQNAEFANAASSNSPNRMLGVNVSSSKLDDILILDSNGRQLSAVSLQRQENNRESTIANLAVESGVKAILPMRLNKDALSDLVVLREGASVPSVVMTAPMNVFFVTSDNEVGDCQGANPCSLRNAIILANQTPGVDVIFISVDIGLIAPLSPLPVISEGVTISGQVNGNNQPRLEISGANMSGQGVDGLKIRTSNTAIYNLAVNEFPSLYDSNTGSSIGGNGITIESTTLSPNNGNNYLSGNYLGTDKTGNLDRGNGGAGLNIFDADDNQIVNNLISGNGTAESRGAGVSVTAGNNNIFHGNIIGLNSLGTGKLGNSQGLFLMGANNDFGGDGAGQGNTVSGNGEPYPSPSTGCFGLGMSLPILINPDTFEILTLNNNIRGNRLGTNPGGTIGLGNCWKAVTTAPLTQSIVGSITQSGRNIISDNGLDGIHCSEFVGVLGGASEGGFCAISGNNIGTDITGNISLPNDWRNSLSGFVVPSGTVEIQNNFSFSNLGAPGGTTPNGACTGFCNLISGNGSAGWWAAGVFGYGTVAVFNNFIGLNQNGNQALPNEVIGLVSSNILGETYIGLGVPNLSLGNVVSGNNHTSIDTGTGAQFVRGFFQTAFIHGNLIGTDSTGNFSVQPEPSGFEYGSRGISASSNFGDAVFIGAGNIEARNVIAGNKGTQFGAGTGIEIYGSSGSIKILNNLIGLNRSLQPLGNQGNGIRIIGYNNTSSVQIGGTDEEANHIAYNGTNGQNFAGVLINNAAQGITVRNNSIHDNFGLGIDLNFSGTFFDGDGVTVNDECDNDADIGANGLQNFPILAAPVTNGDGTQTVSGILKSRVRENYIVDLYSSSAADPSNHGEGQFHLGSAVVQTDANGFVEFSMTSDVAVPAGYVLTATATDSFGSTSEFGPFAGSVVQTREELLNIPSVCALFIVVNIETDQPDEIANDGLCDVDVNEPGLQCSLRAAMQEAEARAGFQRITFAIPGPGVHTIAPATFLPTILQAVEIDASTQDPNSPTPTIHLTGAGSAATSAFNVNGVAATIRGFAITDFATSGVFGTGGATVFVEGCHVGVMPDGTTPAATQMGTGVLLNNAPGSMLGGDLAEKINVISNNVIGVAVQDSTGVRFRNNRIGTNRDANAALPNTLGVKIQDSANMEFGRDVVNFPNIVSGNSTVGIELNGSLTQGGKFWGNLIGTKAGGNESLPNGQYGIYIHNGAGNNGIGTELLPGGYNVISGHDNGTENSAGVFIDQDAGARNGVNANRIGVNADGSAPLPNANGVVIFGDDQSLTGNIISGNNRYGVLVAKPIGSPNLEVTGTRILRNFIGTNFQFSTSVGNGQVGLMLQGNVRTSTVSENNIGNNGLVGLAMMPASANSVGPGSNTVNSNYIGLSQTSSPIPNQLGVAMQGASNNKIYSNVISSNSFFGMLMGSGYSNIVPPTPDDVRFGVDPRLLDLFVASTGGREGLAGVGRAPTANNFVWDNRIGVDSSGSVDFNNHRVGLWVGEYAKDNCIGSCDPSNLQGGAGNTISGHDTSLGIGIFIASLSDFPTAEMKPSGNRFRDNTIGTSRDFSTCIPNRQGFALFQTGDNTIGEINTIPGQVGTFRHGNIITCNKLWAIESIREVGGLTIRGNFIGVVPNFGLNPVLPPGSYGGVRVLREGATSIVRMEDNTIGRITVESISLEEGGGVPSPQPRSVGPVQPTFVVAGNLIGVQPDDDGILQPVPNGKGIRVNCASGAFIGDYFGGGQKKNVIAANFGSGIEISSLPTGTQTCNDSGNNTIKDSIIGTDESGRSGLGNGENGILITDTGTNRIESNIISGNVGNGVQVSGFGDDNRIEGNLIGVIPAPLPRIGAGSNVRLPNGGSGILLENSNLTTVGGTENEDRNTIAANAEAGVKIMGGASNFIVNNNIGTDSSNSATLGNSSHGVWITGGTAANQVGNQIPNTGNTIAFNGGAGVWVDTTAGSDNLIDPNSITQNTGLGIDLGELGRTVNDAGDDDVGPNKLQNYPEITNQTIDGNGDLIVSYKVDSAPSNSDYGSSGLRIEFFKSDLSGEGETFLNADFYTVSDYNSLAPGVKTVNLGNAAALGFGSNDRVTATTSDASGNTSEFFPAFVPTAANVSVSGRVLDSAGRGIPRVSLVATDQSGNSVRVRTNSFGFYRFDELQSGNSYVVTVSHRRYHFAVPTQVIVLSDSLENLDFIARPL